MKKFWTGLAVMLVSILVSSALAKPGDYKCFRTPYGFICTAG